MTNKSIYLSPYDRQSVATITYRPARIAFLIPIKDKDMLLQCVKINSSLWGGVFNGFFPYEEITANGRNFWKEALEKFKPDNMILPKNTSNEILEDMRNKYDLFQVHNIDNCFENGRFNKIHTGVHIFSLFENEKYHSSKGARKKLLFFNYSDEEHLEDLRYAITFGCTDKDKSSLVGHHYLKKECPFDSYINLSELSKTSLDVPGYMNYLIRWIEGEFSTFLDYTILSTERFSRGLKTSNISRYVENPLIILVKDNLMDYMLARNLHHRLLNYPILINISNPEIMKDDIDAFRRFIPKSRYEWFSVFSFGCTESELKEFVDKINVRAEFISEQDILRLFDAEMEFCYSSSEQVVLQKHVGLLLKKPVFFDSLDKCDYFIGEIQFSNYGIPYKRILNNEHWSSNKISSAGYKVLLSGNKDEHVRLMLPDVDDILYTLMAKRNIMSRDTAVRAKMKAVASYFDSFWELDMFTAKEIQNLFFELKSVKKDGFNYGDLCRIMHEASIGESISDDVVKYMISVLIKRNILFRGAIFRCSNCYLTEWITLDDIQNNNKCHSCGHVNLFSDISKTDWRYKLNRLFAEGLDLTVFTTVMYLVGFKNQ